MAGFQIGRRFVLDFTDTDAAGAVVKCGSASVAEVLEIYKDVTTIERESEIVAAHITEWNLEDDGVPVPITAAGLMSLEVPFRALIVAEWLEATRGITAPFDRRSNGGGPSPTVDNEEPFIPMDDV
jgi:hypothetical protein